MTDTTRDSVVLNALIQQVTKTATALAYKAPELQLITDDHGAPVYACPACGQQDPELIDMDLDCRYNYGTILSGEGATFETATSDYATLVILCGHCGTAVKLPADEPHAEYV